MLNLTLAGRPKRSATEPKLLRGSTPRAFLPDLRNPLLRNGLLLTSSSVLTALIGFGYWTVAARNYDTAAVGSNSAAISMMMLVAAIAQLNLSSAMARFVPTAGRRTMPLVAGAYVTCGCVALVVAVGAVLAVRKISPGTTFLDSTGAQVLFVVGTVACTFFVLQDGVLTGLRRTALVPVENAAFALTKVALVVALAAALPLHGIFASWTASLVATVPIVGAFLFLWAIPRHAAADGTDTLPPIRQLARFVGVDYVGAICSNGSAMLLPILVLHMLGPVETAYYAVSWAIANSILLINVNLGTSLVVETAADQSQLALKSREVLIHAARLVIPVVLATIVLAPVVLGIFGSEYRSGSEVLRLLALAAIPHIVVSTAISSARARRRLGLLLSIQVSNFVLTLGFCAVLLHVFGLTGAGWGWLLSQTVVATALILRRDLWLTATKSPHDPATLRFSRLWSATAVFAIRVATATRQRRCLDRAIALLRGTASRDERRELLQQAARFDNDPTLGDWTDARPVRTDSDSTVALLHHDSSAPTAVLKVARSPHASAELQAQHEILTILAADSRLDGWRRLLPRVLAFREDEHGSVSVESFCPKVDLATVLTNNPDRFESLTTMALATIDELHVQTGELVVVDDCTLALWVDEPLQTLTEMCRALSPQSIVTAKRIGALLRSALVDRSVLISWAHGDFHPGNVLMASERGGVTGIVDWGGARPGGLGVLDDYLMVLSASYTVERREFGEIVTRRLRAGGLVEHERHQLENACRARPDAVRGEKLDERVVILLTWLHHIADLSGKCGDYRKQRVWWALNAQPVLRTFADIAPRLEAELRAAELIAMDSVGTAATAAADQGAQP